jgi:putative SOS response-associated peptidase YedK
MCGRYYSRGQKQQIADEFRVGKIFEGPLSPNYNIAPTTFQPIIRLERDSEERELTLLRWGLVPFFAKNPADFRGFSTFNARSESISTAATWREPFKKRRCIVPADGFYEWKRLDNSTKPQKQPFAITLVDGAPLGFAAVWDAWKDKTTGAWLQSFAIITTTANEIMAPIHTRMPVILHQRDWAEWLDRNDQRPPPTHLLRPFDSDMMRASPCNAAVGNVRNNGPEMLLNSQ